MLNPEWRDRVESWRRELARHFYRPLGRVELRGFVTRAQLTPQRAWREPFRPMPVGTKWGAQWKYGWFKTRIVAPRAAAGHRLVAYLTDRESVVFVNGRTHSGRFQPVTLTRRARAGETFDVLFETYAGHGPVDFPCHAGPTPPQRRTTPVVLARQQEVKEATFGVWQEDAYQLWLDVETAADLPRALPPESLRVAELEAGLKDFTLVADFELPEEKLLASCRAARQRLAPLLRCVNGSTAPVFYCFGHGHLDTAWLWPLAHSERKVARTVANQLELLAEYPEHRFLMSQPAQYVWLRDKYPDLYARVKRAVRAGQFIADGAMWVESDTNLPAGESLIRQCLHGRRFFREEFGVDSRLLWLPDVFGYSGALPQILKGCGVDYFSTAKLFWTYHGGDPFPYNQFWWQGIDGTAVLVFLHEDYGAHTRPEQAIRRWHQRRQRDGLKTFLYPFGWGDGGGGPERDHLEFLRRAKDLEGMPRMKLAAPAEFFRDLARADTLNRYVGELYYPCHRGTYTSQARAKRGNRKAEFALREAEMWGAVAAATRGFRYPLVTMDAAWRNLLLHQFHDILPGSSIHRVYEETTAAHRQVIAVARQVQQAAQVRLAKRTSQAVTVFNSLGWERHAVVELPDRRQAEVTVPACGWTTVTAPTAVCHAVATPRSLENDLLRVTFNACGEITGIRDKETGGEWLAGGANRFLMFQDVPSQFDAWDIDSMYELQPVRLDSRAQITVRGDTLRVTRQLHNSKLIQEISLRPSRRRIDFVTMVDWQERHKLLKVSFPVAVHADEAIHEIQFGHVRRPNHRSRPFDADRFEVSQHKWTALAEEGRGAAVLNDCKYGVNVLGQTINLTLLKSSLLPDEIADRGRQEFTYAFYAWNGPFAASRVVQEAYELNCPVTVVAGAAAVEFSAFSVDAANIIIETVKPAEDGSGDVIVRLYEALRTATRCTLRVNLPVHTAVATDMQELPQRRLALRQGRLALEFRPFEVKTILLKR